MISMGMKHRLLLPSRLPSEAWLRTGRLAGAVVLTGLLASSSAWAQSEEFGGSQPGAGAETALGGGTPQVSETHVVENGDTLWDLCSRFLNSPWYWPKIWSYNPQITNPHWIFPGNELRFYPSDENLPTPIASAITVPEDDQIPEYDPAKVVSGEVKIGRVAADSHWSSFVGFMSGPDHKRAGQIVNAEEESVMLSDYDRVYVKLKSPAKKGDTYAIYRTVREIDHPVSGNSVGYAIEVIGGLQIIDTSPTVATAQIAQAFRPIERGFFVAPWPQDFGGRVNRVGNSQEAKGYIVETVGDVLGPIGEHNLVFIDKGRSHGVQKGNTFSVLARGDNYTREIKDLPNEEIGQLMVIDVQDSASTAIVTYALRELSVGDKVVMRP